MRLTILKQITINIIKLIRKLVAMSEIHFVELSKGKASLNIIWSGSSLIKSGSVLSNDSFRLDYRLFPVRYRLVTLLLSFTSIFSNLGSSWLLFNFLMLNEYLFFKFTFLTIFFCLWLTFRWTVELSKKPTSPPPLWHLFSPKWVHL